MSGDGFNPDDFLAESANAPAASDSGGGFNPDQFLKDSDTTDHSTLGEKIKTGIEGVGRGLTYGASDALAKGLRSGASALGVSDDNLDLIAPSSEDMVARQEANPLTSRGSEIGAQVVGAVTGAGAPGLIGSAAKGIVPTALRGAGFWSKIGAGAITGAIEGGLLQGGDEVSKAFLGQGDPEAPVAGALLNMGAASLLGGGVGSLFGGSSSALAKIGETQAGAKMGQLLEDLGNRWGFRQENPNVVTAIYNEVKPFFEENSLMKKNVFQSGGVKDQALMRTLPNQVSDDMIQHAIDMGSTADKVSENLVKDGAGRGGRNEFKQTIARYTDATNNAKTPYDFFKAADQLKQEVGSYVPWQEYKAGLIHKSDPRYSLIKNSASMYDKIAKSLESEATWGDAGVFQKDLNAAVSKFIPAEKDFGTFTKKVQGVRTLDPATIKTYANQLGKSGADVAEEIRPQKMKNYVEASNDFRDEINASYTKHGLDAPMAPHSLNATMESYGQKSKGAEIADYLFDSGVPDFSSKVSSKIAGATAGASFGYHEDGARGALAGGLAGFAAPRLAPILGRAITHKMVPLALGLLKTGGAKGIMQALDYADHASSGVQKMNKGVEALFRGTGQQAIDLQSSDKDREKLRKFVENGDLTRQMQKQVQQAQQPAPQVPAQGYAHGGDIKEVYGGSAPKPVAPILAASTNPLENHAPEQNVLIQAAKGRVNNYLSSIRPQPPMNLPFDKQMPDKQKERSYDKALDIANQPLSILNHIKAGTLTPEQMKHFTSMYPEAHNQISKKITEKITKAQVDGENPPYKVRQAMALFLGSPLDSSMSPQSLQSVQAVYAKAKAQSAQAPGGNPNKGKATLSKVSQSAMTGDQSRIERQQKV